MTSRLGILLAGDLQRMGKYHILTASLAAALLWIAILYFIDIQDITLIFPLLIFIDATSMAIILVGAVMFFERQEGSIKTLLVSPVSKVEYSLSKSLTTVFSSVVTLLILYCYAYFYKEIDLHLGILLVGVLLVALFHSLLGFILTFYSRDFTGLLMNMMKYLFVFMLPVLLEYLEILQHELAEALIYVAPTKASMTLLLASTGEVAPWETAYALGYLGVGSVVLFWIMLKKFDQFAAQESGV